MESYKDKDDDDDSETPSLPTLEKKQISKGTQEMINISGCELQEFQQYMIGQYGNKQFTDGFDMIKSNRNVAYEVNGEQKLMDMLKPLNFQDDEAIRGFINFSTTFLIVQNMNV